MSSRDPLHWVRRMESGEDPEKIALQDVITRSSRCEHVVQIGKDDQRQGEREPAVEITPVAAIAHSEADDGREGEHGEERIGDDHGGRPRAPD